METRLVGNSELEPFVGCYGGDLSKKKNTFVYALLQNFLAKLNEEQQ